VIICPANFFSSASLLLRDFCRLDLEHVAHRSFLDEIRWLAFHNRPSLGLRCFSVDGCDMRICVNQHNFVTTVPKLASAARSKASVASVTYRLNQP
jgi:hypothetical protein